MKNALFLISLLIISCNSESDKILVTKDDGLLYENGSEIPFTGVEKGFVDNKYIEYEVVQGKRHGYFKVMDSQHKLETFGHISNNKYEGKWEYYYPNGKTESVGYFKDNMPSEEWKWFYPNGSLKEVGNYFEGEREGEWKSYSENGEIQQVKYFSSGQIIEKK